MVTPFNSKAARYDYEYFSLYRVCGRVSRGVLRDGGRRFFVPVYPVPGLGADQVKPYVDQIVACWVARRTTLHDTRRYTIPRCLGPSHPDTTRHSVR